MSGTVTKHVFLDLNEYQRLLQAKEKNEELLGRIKQLEKQLEEADAVKRKRNQDGHGNLSGIVARKEQEDALQQPFATITDSISLPPSAQIPSTIDKHTEKKWYFLGPPPKQY